MKVRLILSIAFVLLISISCSEEPLEQSTSFDIVCVACEFQYGVKWRKGSNDNWHEFSNSDKNFCIYKGITKDFDSYCYRFTYHGNVGEYITFDIEAQNGYGTWGDADCFDPIISGNSEPYQIPCFP
jgi:hypothetical protein